MLKCRVLYESRCRIFEGSRVGLSNFRDGLLEVGVLPYNGFTYDHIYGTKVGGVIYDEYGNRHTAADLLEYANPSGLKVLLHASVMKIMFRTKGIYTFILYFSSILLFLYFVTTTEKLIFIN